MLITLLVIAAFVLAGLEVWLLWLLAEREDRRRTGATDSGQLALDTDRRRKGSSVA
jgi:hypothetical protein